MIARIVVCLALVAILGIGCSSNGSATETGERQEASEDAATGGEQQLVTSLQRLAGESPTSSPSPTGSPSQPTQRPIPTETRADPESNAASLDDYLDVCREFNATTIDFDGNTTYGDFSSHLGYMVETLSSIDPPDELLTWHVQSRTLLSALKDAIDSQPPETPIGDEFANLVTGLEPMQEAMLLAVEGIPVKIRRQLAAAGCVDEFE